MQCVVKGVGYDSEKCCFNASAWSFIISMVISSLELGEYSVMVSSTSFKWTLSITKKFIKIRKEKAPIFSGKRNSASAAWNEVIKEMELEEVLTVNQCKRKWDNLTRKYKEMRNPQTGSGREMLCADTWPLYDAMHSAIGERGAINPPAIFSSESTGYTSAVDGTPAEASGGASVLLPERTSAERPRKRRRTLSEEGSDLMGILTEALASQEEHRRKFLALMEELVKKM